MPTTRPLPRGGRRRPELLAAGTVTYLTRQDWNTFPINYNKLNLKIADSPKKDQWIAEMRGETYTISDTGAAAEAVPGPKFTASEIGAEQLNNINDPYWDKLVHAITIDEAVGAVIHGGSRSDTLTNIDNPVVIQNEGPDRHQRWLHRRGDRQDLQVQCQLPDAAGLLLQPGTGVSVGLG